MFDADRRDLTIEDCRAAGLNLDDQLVEDCPVSAARMHEWRPSNPPQQKSSRSRCTRAVSSGLGGDTPELACAEDWRHECVSAERRLPNRLYHPIGRHMVADEQGDKGTRIKRDDGQRDAPRTRGTQ